jgi:hypothetical protein
MNPQNAAASCVSTEDLALGAYLMCGVDMRLNDAEIVTKCQVSRREPLQK